MRVSGQREYRNTFPAKKPAEGFLEANRRSSGGAGGWPRPNQGGAPSPRAAEGDQLRRPPRSRRCLSICRPCGSCRSGSAPIRATAARPAARPGPVITGSGGAGRQTGPRSESPAYPMEGRPGFLYARQTQAAQYVTRRARGRAAAIRAAQRLPVLPRVISCAGLPVPGAASRSAALAGASRSSSAPIRGSRSTSSAAAISAAAANGTAEGREPARRGAQFARFRAAGI